MHTTAGWECPRCHAVWGPAVTGCLNCTPAAAPAWPGGLTWPHTITIMPLPNVGGSCTCTMHGPSSARCPIHLAYRSQVIC